MVSVDTGGQAPTAHAAAGHRRRRRAGCAGRRRSTSWPTGSSRCRDTTPFPLEVLAAVPDRIRAEQALFDLTGAVHAAAAFDLGGQPLVVREDVGRHNAVDKVVGHLLLDGALPAGELGLYVSGRASFEIVQKAWAAGFSALVAVERADVAGGGHRSAGRASRWPGSCGATGSTSTPPSGCRHEPARRRPSQAAPRPVGERGAQRHRAPEAEPLRRHGQGGVGQPQAPEVRVGRADQGRVRRLRARRRRPARLDHRRRAPLHHPPAAARGQHRRRVRPEGAGRRRGAAGPVGLRAAGARSARLPDAPPTRRCRLPPDRVGRGAGRALGRHRRGRS